MALETGTYISDLVSTNPTSSDPKSQGDDHLRLIKATVKASFPNVTGAATPTHTQLNYLSGTNGTTGTNKVVLDTSPTLVTPLLGTPTSGTLTNCTGLPVATGISGLGSGVATFLATPSSANLASAITDETGTGSVVFSATAALTGTPTAPTASVGTATTQIATTAFVGATAFSAALPGQTGNNEELVTTDGTNASWTPKASQAEAEAGTVNATQWMTPLRTAQAITALASTVASQAEAVAGTNNTKMMTPLRVLQSRVSNVTTATTATTLTSTPTLLKITPTSYGVTVTLPDATTCTVGGPLHIIDNRGAFPVRVANSAGTLLGFVFGGVVSHISLDDASTAAGVWAVENGELVGACAQLQSVRFQSFINCISLDSDRELVVGLDASGHAYGVVYNKTTNAFGSVTAIRTNDTFLNIAIIKTATDQAMMVSVVSAAFEAVVLSISGTTITVNAAATATLSANAAFFSPSSVSASCLVAVGTSFIVGYYTVTPATQIREITISGTTPTISAATVLSGTAGPLLVAGSSTVVIAVSTATTNIYTRPYSIGGLAAGTGTTTTNGTMTAAKLAPTGGGRWWLLYQDTTAGQSVGLISLSSTTTTITTAVVSTVSAVSQDAIVVGTTKLLVITPEATNNANIITDSAGTAGAGTAITISAATARACLYASGTDVAVQEGTTTYLVEMIDCSGTSPVLTKTIARTSLTNVVMPVFAASDVTMTRNPLAIYGTALARTLTRTAATVIYAAQVRGGKFNQIAPMATDYAGNSPYRGYSDNQRWLADLATVITKVECVP